MKEPENFKDNTVVNNTSRTRNGRVLEFVLVIHGIKKY